MILEKRLLFPIFDQQIKFVMQTIQQLKEKFISDTESVLKDFGKFK